LNKFKAEINGKQFEHVLYFDKNEFGICLAIKKLFFQ